MDPRAAALYKTYYQPKLAFVQKKGSKDELTKEKNAFNALKEDLFKKAMDKGAVFANVGPQMWFTGKVQLGEKKPAPEKTSAAKALGKNPEVWEFRLDLNTVTGKMLQVLGFDEPDADKIVEERTKRGFFVGDPLKVMGDLIGQDKLSAVQGKTQLAVYTPKVAEEPAKEAAVLWPEDIEKIDLAGK